MFLKTLIVIINLWRRRDGRTEKILKFDRHFPKVTSVNNRFPPHPSVLTIQILFSGEVRSILLAKPWLFFAQTQDAVKVFKVRLSGLQPIVSYVNSDIRNVLFRDLQINRVGVNVVDEKLFRGNVLRSQNGQRGISDVTVLNNIATYVQPRRGHVIGEVHGHLQKRTLPTSTQYVTFGESYNEIPWSIGRMKVKRISAV